MNGLLGTDLDAEAVAGLLEPIGFASQPAGSELAVLVPTDRPDIRPAPHGVADVIEEVGADLRLLADRPPPAGLAAAGTAHGSSARAPFGPRGALRPGRRRGVDPDPDDRRRPRGHRARGRRGGSGQPVGQRRIRAPPVAPPRDAARPGLQRRPPPGLGPPLRAGHGLLASDRGCRPDGRAGRRRGGDHGGAPRRARGPRAGARLRRRRCPRRRGGVGGAGRRAAPARGRPSGPAGPGRASRGAPHPLGRPGGFGDRGPPGHGRRGGSRRAGRFRARRPARRVVWASTSAWSTAGSRSPSSRAR